VDRRNFITNSVKVLLGTTLGATGTKSVELLEPNNTGTTPAQSPILDDWGVEDPLNLNGDFSEGTKYWKGGYVGAGDGTNAKAGIRIFPRDHGEVWLDNPDRNSHANSALMQAVDTLERQAGIQCSNWFLRDHHLMLEAEVRIDYDQPYSDDSWSRVAIATWIQRIDPSKFEPDDMLQFSIGGNLYSKLFTEFDVYRRNVQFLGYNAFASGGNVNEYPADQLPIGYWKPYKIDLNQLIMGGYNALGGWGKENHDEAMLYAWYLAPEAKGSKLQASWRRIKIYNSSMPIDQT
jgi:hypothetical protein